MKTYREHLKRILPYFTAPKEKICKELNQAKLGFLEKHAINIMETFRRGRQLPQRQEEQQKRLQQQEQPKRQEKEQDQKLNAEKYQQFSQQQHQLIQLPDTQPQQFLAHSSGAMPKAVGGLLSQTHTASSFQKSFATAQHSTAMVQSELPGKNTNIGQTYATSSDLKQKKLLTHGDRLQLQQSLKEQNQVQQLLQRKSQMPLNTAEKGTPQMQGIQQIGESSQISKAKLVDQNLMFQQQQNHMKCHAFEWNQAFSTGSPQMPCSSQVKLDSVPQLTQVSRQMPADITSQSNLFSLQQAKGGALTATNILRISSPSTQSVSSPQEVESKISRTIVTATFTPGSTEFAEAPQSLSIPHGTPQNVLSPLVGLSPFPCSQVALEDGLQHDSPNRSNVKQPPLERLVNKMESMNPKALCSAVGEMMLTASFSDMFAPSARAYGFNGAINEDLALSTRNMLQSLLSDEGSKNGSKRARALECMALFLTSDQGDVQGSLKVEDGCEVNNSYDGQEKVRKKPKFQSRCEIYINGAHPDQAWNALVGAPEPALGHLVRGAPWVRGLG
eukprot:Gb_34504 [translate_table: standard]